VSYTCGRPALTRIHLHRLRNALVLSCVLLAANFVVTAAAGGYDVRLAGLHLVAHGSFKPLLYLNAAFLLACLAGFSKTVDAPASYEQVPFVRCAAAAALVAICAHWNSMTIDLSFHDWNHSHISSGLRTTADFARLFSRPQADGFYRPLTFLSLWFDYRVFHQAPIAYHVHSLLLHLMNALLVGWLAKTIGYSHSVAGWAAVLYAAVPGSFEPVTWPAARFDVLATFFTLLAVICALRYLKDDGKWIGGASVCLLLGLLNKESSYAVPAVVAVWALLAERFGFPPVNRARTWRLLAVLVAICVAMLLIRFTVFGSMGGYPAAPGRSSQFVLSFRTFASLFSRMLPLSVAVFNTTDSGSRFLRYAQVLLPLVLIATAAVARTGKREIFLLCLMLVAALPVLNLVGWLGPLAQNSRYLYLPACFMCIFLPAVVSSSRARTLLLAGWVLVFAICLRMDQVVYQRMIERIPATVAMVAADARDAGEPVNLVNVPEDPWGVYYFRLELVARLKTALPGATIVPDATAPSAGLNYDWSPEGEALLRRAGFIPRGGSPPPKH